MQKSPAGHVLTDLVLRSSLLMACLLPLGANAMGLLQRAEMTERATIATRLAQESIDRIVQGNDRTLTPIKGESFPHPHEDYTLHMHWYYVEPNNLHQAVPKSSRTLMRIMVSVTHPKMGDCTLETLVNHS